MEGWRAGGFVGGRVGMKDVAERSGAKPDHYRGVQWSAVHQACVQ